MVVPYSNMPQKKLPWELVRDKLVRFFGGELVSEKKGALHDRIVTIRISHPVPVNASLSLEVQRVLGPGYVLSDLVSHPRVDGGSVVRVYVDEVVCNGS